MASIRRRWLAAALCAGACSGIVEIGTGGEASTAAATGTTGVDDASGSEAVSTGPGSDGSAGVTGGDATDSMGTGGSGSTGPGFPYGPCPDAACPKDPAEACLADDGTPPEWTVCATVCQTARDCPVPTSGDAAPACDVLAAGLPRLTGCLLPCGPTTACPDGMACIGAAGLGAMVCAWPGSGA